LQLARHFEEAALWDKAVDYRLRAGDQARRHYAPEDAIDHIHQALALMEKVSTSARARSQRRAHTALGELLTMTGAYDEARIHLREALSLVREESDDAAQAHLCRWMGWSYENQADYDEARRWVDAGLEALQGCETAEAVQLRLLAGLIHLRQGQIEAALAQAEIAFRMAKLQGDRRPLARTYLLLTVIMLQRGQNRRSVELARRALDLYTQSEDLAGQAKAHNQIANALFNMGRWTQAADSYTQARDTFRRAGDLYNRALVENNLGEIALNQGRLAEAVAAYREALRISESAGSSPYILGILHNNLGAVLVRQGSLEAAHDQLAQSRDCFEAVQSRDILPELYRHWAALALRRQEPEEAWQEAERSLMLARELHMQNEVGITLRLRGEIALEQQNLPAAAASLRESLDTLQGLGEAFQIARTHLALAHLALALGRGADARAELAKCEPVFGRLDMGPELEAARQLRVTLAQRPRR
jgi:tetratricopeptide (TPR) repeat protein